MRRVLAAVLAFTFLTPPGVSAAAPSEHPEEAPAVYPAPQSIRSRPETVRFPSAVTIVAGPDDISAAGVVQDALRGTGVRTVRNETPADRDGLTVYVGRGTGDALGALGVNGSQGIADEGYVLAAGKGRDGKARIVLDGVDPAGTFYAAQTFRQLVGRSKSLRGVEVRDWPSLRWRGVVEGFYGPPWTHETRLTDLDFYGRHKMNSYVYTPKDDPYLRAEWRKPHPPEALRQLTELVTRAKANHVEFTYVLSPGLSVCYSRESEVNALIAKFGTLRSIGVRSFVLAFDDIDYQRWNCDEDRAAFGTGPAASAQAQVLLSNRVQRDFVAAQPGLLPLQIVPTEYWGTTRTGYTETIAATLERDVVVQWTGVDVIAPQITRTDVATAKDMFRHPILIWDNYPVNDYVPGRLLLGPFTGREPGLSTSVIGLTANPMPQAQASKTSLFTVADYTWNDTLYDPARSWAAGLDELAGGDARTLAALRAFADVNYSSRIDNRPSPQLSGDITRFWPAWFSGNGAAITPLRRALTKLHEAPKVLRARMNNPGFLTETAPWLDATGAWAQAALTALDILVAQRDNRGAEAWAARQALPALVAKARSFTWVGLDPDRPVRIELDPTLERFIADARAENSRWFGVPEASPITNLPAYDGRFPASNMADGDPATYFWGAASAQPEHYVGLDLGANRPVSEVKVLMAKPDSPDDYIHTGVLEYSLDGTTWSAGPSFAGTSEVTLALPAGTTARFVRLRATEPQPWWIVVREFSVHGSQVTGAPDGELALAADHNLNTAYRASRPPAAGEALTLVLPSARPLNQLLVLAQAKAEVQVLTGDSWVGLGRLFDSGYTALPGRGLVVSAVRLAWTAGSPPPVVHEIVAT